MIAYVILNYNTKEITKDCITHLLEVSGESEIVIVDNGSHDGSADDLSTEYKDNARIHIVASETNLGFARGNNLGFRYVKENFSPDMVVVMNNDIIISQKDFEEKLSGYMDANGLDLCGPDILTPEGSHQNPLLRKPFGTFRLIKQIMIDVVRLTCLRLSIFTKRIMESYSANSQSFHKSAPDLNGITDCILQGSCVVYGKRWIEREDIAFVPITFLYGEEMILFEHCKKKGYRTGICPNAQLLHLGGKSTKLDLSAKDKQIFKTRMAITANWKLVKYRLWG